ncbi:MAG TPA: hypothetical protein VKQ52_18240 [Puia sp.]|nr:hypothetical protein [Puia sp.]
MKPALTAVATLALFALACNKHNSNPPQPSPSDSLRTYNLAFSYPDSSRTPAADWELIVTEPGGKQLLDTIVPVNTPITATIHTTHSLVNLGSVYRAPTDTSATVRIITGIDPATITSPVPNFVTSPQLLGPTVNRAIYYQNIPANDINHRIYYSQDILPVNFDINSFGHMPRRVGNYYLINYASKGLYHFYPWRDGSATDTFDLALLTDTSTQLNLTTHAGYGRPLCWVVGIMDTTDYRKSVFLYNYIYNIYQTVSADIVYPTKNVQKFELRGTYIGNDSTEVTIYTYGNTVTADHPFMDASIFTLLSRQQDSFAVKFSTTQLSYYGTYWKIPGLDYYTYSSPDSPVSHPLALINSLKSRKLQSQSLSPLTHLTPGWLLMQTTPGLNYADYMSYVCNVPLWKARRVASATQLVRKF